MALTTTEAFKDALSLFDLAKRVGARHEELKAAATASGAVPDEVDIDLQLGKEFLPEAIDLSRTIRADIKS